MGKKFKKCFVESEPDQTVRYNKGNYLFILKAFTACLIFAKVRKFKDYELPVTTVCPVPYTLSIT